MSAPSEPRRYAGVPVLVLGATGFVGRWVARALANAGAEVHLAVRDVAEANQLLVRYGAAPAPTSTHRLDARDLEAVGGLVSQVEPRVVFNLIGYGVDPDERRAADPDAATRLNAELPAAIAEAIEGESEWTGRRLVHVGSVFEYGPIGGDLPEDATARPVGLYGSSKLAGTLALADVARRRGVASLTARLCQLYGPGEHPGRLLPLLMAIRAGGAPVRLSLGTQRKDFTYVEDVASGLLRLGLTSGPPGEIVNLATGKLTSVRDFALTAARLLPLPPEALRFEKPIDPNELRHDPIAIGRLRRLTGWAPMTTVEDGIARTLAFERP
jgi:nucleoside-diphosphate-sugar epimerase